jgi:hypothetical protein
MGVLIHTEKNKQPAGPVILTGPVISLLNPASQPPAVVCPEDP